MMRERPILFNGAMTRAILDGTKSQTRRVVKPRGGFDYARMYVNSRFPYSIFDSMLGGFPCPYGVPGDRLWVRETFLNGTHTGDRPWVRYRATDENDLPLLVRWKPPIFMPRWLSRLTLEIADVRVQRVQEISEEDARAEGSEPVYWSDGTVDDYRGGFRHLWNDINAKRGFGWDANPWVWALTFKRLQ